MLGSEQWPGHRDYVLNISCHFKAVFLSPGAES